MLPNNVIFCSFKITDPYNYGSCFVKKKKKSFIPVWNYLSKYVKRIQNQMIFHKEIYI